MAISRDREQLTRVERDIASAKERIAWHKKNIEKLTREGRKTDLAEAMLDSWARILLVFEQHREVVRTWLKERPGKTLILSSAPRTAMRRRARKRWPRLPRAGGATSGPPTSSARILNRAGQLV